MKQFRCARCTADPKPKNFASSRRCAFTAQGRFTSDNWRCATLDALFQHLELRPQHFGSDQTSLDAIDCEPERDGGLLVITSYKRRGRASSLLHVGDFHPARSATLAKVERTIQFHVVRASHRTLQGRV